MRMGYKPYQISASCPVTLQHIKDITNNFSEEKILGRGGFSMVYKGELQSGQIVAVKKLVRAMPSSHKQLENEVHLLMKLQHSNIIRPIGYYSEKQLFPKLHEGQYVFYRSTESFLFLEYLPKGSLKKYISGASSGIDWQQRWKIIEGISSGLYYLHEQCNPPIIHLDLKPSNILLDKNMMPKIADFGLSRIYDKKKVIPNITSSGTLGYMPPEYLLHGIVTPMSDIFSLGVIIIELITGHKKYPFDKPFYHEFIEHEVQKWTNVLENEVDRSSLEFRCQEIKKCLIIGLDCVNPKRHERPTINNIVNMLHGLEIPNVDITNEETSHTTNTKMEMKLSEGATHGGETNEAHVVYEVLSRYTCKPMFRHSVGVVHHPIQSEPSKPAPELGTKRSACAEFWDIINTQREQIDELEKMNGDVVSKIDSSLMIWNK